MDGCDEVHPHPLRVAVGDNGGIQVSGEGALIHEPDEIRSLGRHGTCRIITGKEEHRNQDQDMYDFFGGHPWEIPEVYGAASPLIRVCEKTPPMLFLHGDQDHYPHRQSIYMGERLKHYGVYSEVEIYEGKGHAWFNREPDTRITTARMTAFIERVFKL